MLLGSIAGVFGIRGELKIVATRVGEDALREGLAVVLRGDDGGNVRESTISSVRRHKGRAVVMLEGIVRAEAAEEFVGTKLWALRENVVLAQGEYYDEDLIGCRIVEAGRNLGSVRAVRHYPAQDVLELERGRFVPMVSAFVRRIDIEARIIDVELPPGLVEGDPL
ncbi:MAG: ribosome maturation factor RimM [Vulcanimicrobiaceae bacterium]